MGYGLPADRCICAGSSVRSSSESKVVFLLEVFKQKYILAIRLFSWDWKARLLENLSIFEWCFDNVRS